MDTHRNKNLICRFHFSVLSADYFSRATRKVISEFSVGYESYEEDGRGRNPGVALAEGTKHVVARVMYTSRARRRNRQEACVTPRETLGWRATTEGEAVLTNSSRNGDKERCPSFMKNSVDCELSLSLSAPSCPSLLSRYPYLFILASPFCLRMMIV